METKKTSHTVAKAVHDGLAGLGLLYALQVSGLSKLTVQGIEISPSQAQAIQNQLEYSSEPVAKKRGK